MKPAPMQFTLLTFQDGNVVEVGDRVILQTNKFYH
jgi:hypothetical protein